MRKETKLLGNYYAMTVIAYSRKAHLKVKKTEVQTGNFLLCDFNSKCLDQNGMVAC